MQAGDVSGPHPAAPAPPTQSRIRRRRLTERKGPVGGLVVRLEALRHELGMGEEAFAKYLGISSSHWFRLRQGTGRPGPSLLTRVMRERPDFATLVAGEFTRR